MMSSERSDHENRIPFDIWRTSGTTTHLGGVFATRRLIALSGITARQRVLDVGCGTGYTACYLASRHRARVVGLDISLAGVRQARRRALRSGLGDQVALLQADAHQLPFSAGHFDAVIVESVLTFCEIPRVLAEVHRVLRGGGIIASNELALTGPPPVELNAILDKLGLRAAAQPDWQAVFRQVGFGEIVSVTRQMSFFEQVWSRLRVDGLAGYIKAARKSLANEQIRELFVNRDMLRAARQLRPFIGYHLYVGSKSAL